jgi:hypothetical protein
VCGNFPFSLGFVSEEGEILTREELQNYNNSFLFTYKLNSPEANYKVSTSKKEETRTEHNKTVYVVVAIALHINNINNI